MFKLSTYLLGQFSSAGRGVPEGGVQVHGDGGQEPLPQPSRLSGTASVVDPDPNRDQYPKTLWIRSRNTDPDRTRIN